MQAEVRPVYEFGSFRLDVANRQLIRLDQTVTLTPKLFDLLVYLLEHPGRALGKDELLGQVWPDSFVSEENLSRHISTLRKALNDGNEATPYIETLPKIGYRFTAQVRRVAQPAAAPVGSGVQTDDLPALPVRSLAHEANEFPSELAELERMATLEAKPKRGWFLLAAVLTVALTAFGLYRWFNRAANEPAVMPKIVPFTSMVNRENYPAFSPDDKMLAFTWDGADGNNTDVYVKLVGSGEPLRLTTDEAPDISPVWSPDGQSLAFVRLAQDGAAIYQVAALGGTERALVTGIWSAGPGVPSGRLAWSPDGKSLVYAATTNGKQPNLQLYLLDLASGARRQLTNTAEDDRNPVFAPDGQTLAFIRGLDELYVMPSAGGTARQLTFDNKRIFGLAWSADGRELIFSSARAGEAALWKVAAMGGAPLPLTPSGEQVGNLAVSHRGHQLVYAQTVQDSNIWQATTNDATATPAKFIASTRKETHPQFSPDGQRVAFISTRSGNTELWTCDSAGQQQTQLTSFNGPQVGHPRWSPDGSQLAFHCSAERDQLDVYVIAARGGTPRRITNDLGVDALPAWSHDGQWLYFRSNRSGALQIWKQSLNGGAAIQVTQQGGGTAWESFDGQFLYFTKAPDTPGIWRMPAAGGAETQVLPQGREGDWALLAQGLYFLDPSAQPRAVLAYYDFASARITPLTPLEKRTVNGLTVSPIDRKLLWSQLDQYESDLVMLNDFR